MNTSKTHHLRLEKNNDVTAQPFFDLQQQYEQEFSPTTGYKPNAEGLFDQIELMSHWSPKGFDIYILFNDDRPIGFTVVNLSSMVTGDPKTRDIAEFFVIPEFRKTGVGKWMAHYVFNKYPDTHWEVRQLPELPAKEFWVKIISEFAPNFKNIEMRTEAWEGSVQYFQSK